MAATATQTVAVNGAGPTKDADSPKLFVGQVPRSFTEDELRNVLSDYGTIYELVIMKDKVCVETQTRSFLLSFAPGQSLGSSAQLIVCSFRAMDPGSCEVTSSRA